ncbi:iron-sulfur cluster assembly scaffold protein [candidate division KSB1 bacterium]|nr:MAG: iron-sulfur cluster assembly scaffold protein [candidate division KSB1 bacterium]
MSEIEKIFSAIESQFMGQSSERFSDKVLEFAYDPLNTGEIEDPDGTGFAKGECGDSMTIFLKTEKNKIKEARFLADGCGATLACGSAVTELVKDKSLFNAKNIYPQTVIRFLDGLPASHTHCSVLAVQALRKALDDIDTKLKGK